MAKTTKTPDPVQELLADHAPSPGPTATMPTVEDAEAKHAATLPAEPEPTPEEIAALEKRIADWKKKQGVKAAAAANGNLVRGIEPDLNPTHRVSVKDSCRNVLVHASDVANAELRYRQKTGMIRTEHAYEVEQL